MRKQIKKTKLLKIFFTFATICCAITLVILMQNENMINPIKNEGTAMPLTIESKEKNTANYYEVTSTDGKKVPVPKGYRASDVLAERSVNGGFVIYEGEDEPVPTDEAGLMQAQINRNQWVWIPISSEEFENMYHVNTSGIYGNYYEYSRTATAPELKTTSYKEPIVSYKTDLDSTYLTQYLNGISKQQFKLEIKEKFYELLQSVKTYGGFYISRYEISDLDKNIPSSKRLHDNINQQNWYKMYEKCKNLKGNNDTVDTNLMWEIQYDEILNWLLSTGNKTYSEIALAPTSWGHFSNSTFTYYDNELGTSTATKEEGTRIQTEKLRSGITDYAKTNNIYDLVGNVDESTMSSLSGESFNERTCRGGSCYDNSNYNSMATKKSGFKASIESPYVGCRATLYIM